MSLPIIRIGLFLLAATLSQPALAMCVTVKYRDTPVSLETFECVETPQSSFVSIVCYDFVKSYCSSN